MPKNTIKLGKKTAKKNLDQFLTLDLDQFLTLETPNLGPVFNSTAYIYMYVYAVKSIIGPSLAIFKVNNWAKSKSIIGPRSFSHYKNRGFRRFFFAQLSLCVFFVPSY